MPLDEYKNPSIVSGMGVKDVLRMDPDTFDDMSESDVRKLVGRLVSAGNKRMRTFEKRGEQSPAYNRAIESGGKFSTAGKSVEELKEEFARARAFLKSETGSVRRWNKTKKIWKEMSAKISDKSAEEITTDVTKSKTFWNIFEEMKKRIPGIITKKDKSNAIGILKEYASMMIDEGIDIDVLYDDYYMDKMKSDFTAVYEEQEALNNAFDATVSEFFN